ncbi:MAG: RNA methyltransferase [Clostridia bacterium]|nr:RNA methyltransferase [Clostridia bacterium]
MSLTRDPNRIYLEGMTSINALFGGIRSGVNDRTVFRVFYDGSRKDKKYKELSFLQSQSPVYGYSLIECSPEDLNELVSGHSHGGFVAECSGRTVPPLDGVTPVSGFYALLEGIEDPYNFGSCIRSLYAFGANGIVVTERDWSNAASVVCRSSAGLSERIPQFRCTGPEEAVALFRKAGFRVVCANIRDSVPLEEADLSFPVLLVIGGEKRGISRAVLDACDLNVRIDYASDFKGSLGTAAAAAILAQSVAKYNHPKTTLGGIPDAKE